LLTLTAAGARRVERAVGIERDIGVDGNGEEVVAGAEEKGNKHGGDGSIHVEEE
jgi:hypothetical protein